MRSSRFLLIAFLIPSLLAGTTMVRAASLVIGSSEFHNASTTPAAMFNPFDGGWRVGNNAGESDLVAAVRLPQDATVNSFTMYYFDNSAGIIECNLRRAEIAVSNQLGSGVLGATASTENDALDHFKTDAIIVNPVIDNTVYYYYVKVTMANGDGERKFLAAVVDYTDPVTAVGDGVTPVLGRASAHPNPFQFNTAIRFSMQTAGPVTVDIYDLQGRLVRTLRDPFLPAGSHSLPWDGLDAYGKSAPGGVYFAQVKGQDEALAAKLVRVR